MAIDTGTNSTSLFLIPGMTAKIKALDHFIWDKPTVMHRHIDGSTSERTVVNGFVVDDEEVGSLTAVENEPAVRYLHKKYSENVITFYSRHSESVGKVYVTAVPIHDHASIVTGGPAYGTYFTDDESIGGSE